MYNISYLPNHEYSKSKFNILIVDDDNNSGSALQQIIIKRGHNVTLLNESMKFVNRCYDNTFDIVFVDYHIDEDMNGSEIIDLLKDKFKNTLVYVYTGDDSKNTLENIKKNKINGVFIKPLNYTLIDDFFFGLELKHNNKYFSKLALKNKNFLYFI
jgi:DNA-binding NtrC family response regulator